MQTPVHQTLPTKETPKNNKQSRKTQLSPQINEFVISNKKCKHLQLETIPYEVNGEPRRVVRKCLDCGEVVDSTNLGR